MLSSASSRGRESGPRRRAAAQSCGPSGRPCRNTARRGSRTSSRCASWTGRCTSRSATPSPRRAPTSPHCAPGQIRERRRVRGRRAEGLHHRRARCGLHLARLPLACVPAQGHHHPHRRHRYCNAGFSWTPIITHDGAHCVSATYYCRRVRSVGAGRRGKRGPAADAPPSGHPRRGSYSAQQAGLPPCTTGSAAGPLNALSPAGRPPRISQTGAVVRVNELNWRGRVSSAPDARQWPPPPPPRSSPAPSADPRRPSSQIVFARRRATPPAATAWW